LKKINSNIKLVKLTKILIQLTAALIAKNQNWNCSSFCYFGKEGVMCFC